MRTVADTSETRTYWMVCEERAHGKWCHHGFFRETQEEGERRLRWLRQWHPKAFLVEMALTRCADNHGQPLLPERTSKPQPDSNGKPKLRLV